MIGGLLARIKIKKRAVGEEHICSRMNIPNMREHSRCDGILKFSNVFVIKIQTIIHRMRFEMSLYDIIGPWAKLAKGESIDTDNPFIRFISIWIAFGGIYTALFDSTSENQRIRKFSDRLDMKGRHNMLLGSEEEYKDAVEAIAEKGILDINNLEGDPLRIYDKKELRQVLRCVYQVRCNLFHSGKDINDPRDIKLVSASFTIISKLIDPLLTPEKINELDKTTDSAYDDIPGLPS